MVLIIVVEELFGKFCDTILSPVEICESALVSNDSERWKIDVVMWFSSRRDLKVV